MLNSVFFLSDSYSHFNSKLSGNIDSRIYLSFLADPSSTQKMHQAYKFFSENEGAGFSLTLAINGTLSSDVLQDILPFFFIPAYYNINNERVLNLLCNDNNLFENVQKLINDWSCGQGVENVAVNQVADLNSRPENLQPPENYLFNNIDSLVAQYRTTLKSENMYNNVFYLSDPTSEPGKLYSLIEQAEDEIKTLHPVLYQSVNRVQSLLSENQHFKKKCLYLANELDNYKTHIEILRSSHQANELQKYYDNEYEILPLWYKRIGHIVKVLTGKRRFRSLFNDNTIKHKD